MRGGDGEAIPPEELNVIEVQEVEKVTKHHC